MAVSRDPGERALGRRNVGAMIKETLKLCTVLKAVRRRRKGYNMRSQIPNRRRSLEARQKIAVAVSVLVRGGVFLSLRTINEASGVARSSIRRHGELWKPEQARQYNERQQRLKLQVMCVGAEKTA